MTDRRIIKTKSAIRASLFDIILSKNISDITITELCEKANINRKTFYSHYSNIVDVVNESLGELVSSYSEFITSMAPEYNSSVFDVFSTFLVRFIQYNPDIVRILKSPNGMWLEQKLKEALTALIEETIHIIPHIDESAQKYIPFISEYVASGLVSVYCSWAVSSRSISADEITKVLSQVTINGMAFLSK